MTIESKCPSEWGQGHIGSRVQQESREPYNCHSRGQGKYSHHFCTASMYWIHLRNCQNCMYKVVKLLRASGCCPKSWLMPSSRQCDLMAAQPHPMGSSASGPCCLHCWCVTLLYCGAKIILFHLKFHLLYLQMRETICCYKETKIRKETQFWKK